MPEGTLLRGRLVRVEQPEEVGKFGNVILAARGRTGDYRIRAAFDATGADDQATPVATALAGLAPGDSVELGVFIRPTSRGNRTWAKIASVHPVVAA